MSDDEAKRRYAHNLLALALHARGRGDEQLADDLIARAFEVLDELNGNSLSPPTSSTPMQQQPQQQQQQQQRSSSEKGDEDN
jgi:hypothetical protein